jgi:hypothetical protein
VLAIVEGRLMGVGEVMVERGAGHLRSIEDIDEKLAALVMGY